jgi:hypothetical protein
MNKFIVLFFVGVHCASAFGAMDQPGNGEPPVSLSPTIEGSYEIQVECPKPSKIKCERVSFVISIV